MVSQTKKIPQPLEKSIEKGRVAEVQTWLEHYRRPPSWGRPRDEDDQDNHRLCVRDSDGEWFNPLRHAMAHGKTSIVFLLLEQGWKTTPEEEADGGFYETRPHQTGGLTTRSLDLRNGHLLSHVPDREVSEPTPPEFGPNDLRPRTDLQATFQAVMRYVQQRHMFRPLTKPQVQRLVALRDALVKEEGTSMVLIRFLTTPADWLKWCSPLLEAGANPNTYAWNPHDGTVINALSLAAVHGMGPDTKALLKGGANPLWRDEAGNTPAHIAADLTKHSFLQRGLLVIDLVERRRDCLQHLLATPGAAAVKNFQGMTAGEIWQLSLEKVHAGWKGPEEKTDPQVRANYRQRLLMLGLQPTDSAHTPAKPKPRF